MVYIPGLFVNKVYERGRLVNTADGFQFSFRNTILPVKISGMRDMSLDVDGQSFTVEEVCVEIDGNPIDISSGTMSAGKFDRDSRIVIKVKGKNLADGKHVLRLGFVTNEYGGATLKFSDAVGQQQTPSIWSRIGNWISGGGKPTAGVRPVIIEGELGGVPLDPDFSRLEAVLRREEPDRVPLFEMEIDMPIQEWFLGRELEGAADDIEFYIRAGYDYVPVIPAFLAPRLMRVASGEGLSGSDRERTWITESEGIIKTVADVENFPWPKAEDVDFSLFYDVAALLPPKMKILGMLAPAAIFGNSSQSMGLENFSYALYDNVAVVEALFEILGSTYLEIAKRLTKMPRVGSVHMADDLAHGGGCLVSPKVYRKYVFPWYKKIAGVLTDAGLPLSFHSDGNLEQVLDDLADCGIRGIHPIEPLAMDIVDIKKRYGDRFAIFGNIDLEYTLTRGTVEEVEALVKERIKRLAPGGGYAVGSSNSVPDYVKPENYRAMVEATKKYGKYPISI
jgi:uroporphyrinogen decarboxylase